MFSAACFAKRVIIVLTVVLIAAPANAHSVFKRTMQRRYELASVSCVACHVPEADRSERNELGEVFEEHLDGKELSAKFAAAKREGFESRRRFEESMAREFLKALTEIEPLRSRNGQTYRARFRSGSFNGLEVR